MLVITAIFSQGQYFFGYAKPTPVNPMNLQGGRHGEALVAAAGPLSNLVMAAIVAIPLRLAAGLDRSCLPDLAACARSTSSSYVALLLRAHQRVPVHLQPAAGTAP